jgi:transketolase
VRTTTHGSSIPGGAVARNAWEERLAAFRAGEPTMADEYEACIEQRGLAGWESKLPVWGPGDDMATRQACAKVVNAVLDVVPGLVCGGADLTENTGMELKDAEVVDTHRFGGRQVHYGIREHGMGSVMNGMAVSGLLPAGGTFFVFSDYMRPSARLAALSQYKTAFVWTHDSVGVGEDGPTHQPVEQLAALRAMPGLPVVRPADANETAAAWRAHVNGDGPTAMVLSRQKLPVLDGTAERAVEGVAVGAYVLSDAPDGLQPALVLIGTGSEVWLCVDAAAVLRADGVATRVVSMPCWEHFEARSLEEQAAVLPPGTPTLAVEAGVSFGWERYADDVVAMHGFGASAPGDVALREFGFTVDNVVTRARALLGEGS